jgi:adenylate cyclase
MCGAPFGGLGSRLVSPLGYFPSRKNPNICATCVELAPPGGMTTQAGVLFADIRGFTARAAEAGPVETSRLLRRFYACAEDVLLPGALIDKLIGDAVMALYLPIYNLAGDPASRSRGEPRDVAMVMIRHARQLLARIGYGTPDGPFAEIGIGLDFGELFIGNIGDGAVSDFTAIGDVVNTASRLQGAAGGGEILASERLAAELAEPPGERIEVQVKGKPAPVAAYRIRANGR